MAKVLVVDDEPDVLNALARALRLAGHEVSKSSSPDEAIGLAREHPFDLAILDYIMPAMTGVDLLNRLRELHPTIKSIIVSGKLDAQVEEAALTEELRNSVEADVYLHKPIENQKLLANVKSLMEAPVDEDWKSVAKRNLYKPKKASHIRRLERSINTRRKKK